MTDAYSSVNPPMQDRLDADAPGGDAGVKDKAKDVAGTAKDQASQLGSSAADSAKNVAGTAKAEAGNVAGEAKQQAKALYDEATTQLRDQAGQQQTRAAKGLHGIGDELSTMSKSSEQQGLAAELVSQIASRATGVATWLESREPSDVLDEVKAFARRRPVAFIALSAVAGLVAGRLVRSLASEAKDEKDAAAAASTPTAASGTTPPPPAPGTQVFPATSGYEAAQGVPATSIDGSGQPRHAAPATFVDAPPAPPVPPAAPGQGTNDLDGYQR